MRKKNILLYKLQRKTYKKNINLAMFQKINNKLFKKLFWIRYSNNILIGMLGSRVDCDKIKSKINQMFKLLKLKINNFKFVIQNCIYEQTFFLGCNLKMPLKRLFKHKKNKR